LIAPFVFTVSGLTSVPTPGTTYTHNGSTHTVISAHIRGDSGTIVTGISSGTTVPAASGTLTKASGIGDSTIAFSAWSGWSAADYTLVHEGRPGWALSTFVSTGLRAQRVTCSGVTVLPTADTETGRAVYSDGTNEFIVDHVFDNGGGDVDLLLRGSVAPTGGTLTKTHGTAGDATISFSAVDDVPNSPLINPDTGSVDFDHYFTAYGVEVPDVIYICLGVNDIAGYRDDVRLAAGIVTALANYDTLVNAVAAYNTAQGTSIKVKVVTPPTGPWGQDAYGADAIGTSGRTATRYKRNLMKFIAALQTHFASTANVTIIPVHLVMDTSALAQGTFAYTPQPIHACQPNVLVNRAWNGVHPGLAAAMQAGDQLYAEGKANW
jgi:hypothetical protein